MARYVNPRLQLTRNTHQAPNGTEGAEHHQDERHHRHNNVTHDCELSGKSLLYKVAGKTCSGVCACDGISNHCTFNSSKSKEERYAMNIFQTPERAHITHTRTRTERQTVMDTFANTNSQNPRDSQKTNPYNYYLLISNLPLKSQIIT